MQDESTSQQEWDRYTSIMVRNERGVMTYAGVELHERNGKFYFEDPVLAEKHVEKTDKQGPDKDKLAEFMLRHDLKESYAYRFASWDKMLPVKQKNRFRSRSAEEFYSQYGELDRFDKLADHQKIFVNNQGERFYFTQPYQITVEKYQIMERAWRSLGLLIDISIKDAWYYPGKTPLIVVSKTPLELIK